MNTRYNIALRPTTQSDNITKIAQQFSHFYDTYLLGERSLPHVTLCQFRAEKSELNGIWKKTCELIKPKPIQLTFEQLSCTPSDNHFWIALLPNSRDILIEMHYIVADIIKTPLNKSFENYYPHMTLFNTKKEQNFELFIKQISPIFITDSFVLSLGKSDEEGQFIEDL